MKATNRSALRSWTAHSAGPQQPCSENGFLPFHQISRHRPIVFHAYFMRPIQDESWSCNSRYTSWFARKGLKMHCVLDAQANGSYGGRNGHNRLTILAELDYGNEERRPHEVSDVILPVQYYESARRARFLCGERRLMLALLADAICCLLTVGLRYERLRQEARRWLAGRGPSPVSFEAACEALGLDPDATRVSIENLVASERGPALRAHLTGRRRYRRLHPPFPFSWPLG
jgi:hypothetical protein